MQNVNYPGSQKAQGIAVILIVIAVIVLVFFVVKKFFGGFESLFGGIGDTIGGAGEWLNLKDTEQEAAIRKAIADAENTASSITSPWNATYYKSAPAGTSLLTRATADKYAKQIWDSVGVVSDDSAAGVAVFKSLSNKAMVSWLCDVFNQNYKRDLFQWLKLKYDTDTQRADLKVIIDYVNSLKAY
jgi:hypothetical protein